MDPSRVLPPVVLAPGSLCLVSFRSSRDQGESSFNQWQLLPDLGQITPISWASVVSCRQLEFQYPCYPLGGIVENIRVTEEKRPQNL